MPRTHNFILQDIKIRCVPAGLFSLERGPRLVAPATQPSDNGELRKCRAIPNRPDKSESGFRTKDSDETDLWGPQNWNTVNFGPEWD